MTPKAKLPCLELEQLPHERMDLHISYFISSPERVSEQPPSSVVNTNISMPCLLYSEPRNTHFAPTQLGSAGLMSLLSRWREGRVREQDPLTSLHPGLPNTCSKLFSLIITDNNDHVGPLQSLTPQREQPFLISTCIKVNAPL